MPPPLDPHTTIPLVSPLPPRGAGGQSNMELPMLHEHSRNSSYDAVLAGAYDHIRLFEMGKNKLRDGSGKKTTLFLRRLREVVYGRTDLVGRDQKLSVGPQERPGTTTS